MAENVHNTSAHDPADHGHHGHHILSAKLLLTVFFSLVGLTIFTVGLGLLEQNEIVHLGAFSVPVALAIAGVKATLVAMFFMALKYDNKVNLLAFSLSIVFLVVFFVFTFLDTGFRGSFDDFSATPIDQTQLEELRLQERNDAILPDFEAQPLLLQGDTALIDPTP
ncbi:MAG: cytochrome C oxidase subunit IV family protein [Bacteroidota bacterium]